MKDKTRKDIIIIISYIALVIFALVGVFALYFADPNDKTYEYNQRFIQVMSMLPSFGARLGPLILLIGLYHGSI